MNCNIRNNIRETGIVETSMVVRKYLEISQIYNELTYFLPVSKTDPQTKMAQITDRFKTLSKDRLMIIGPEIGLIESLKESQVIKDFIICLPATLDKETIHRIQSNVPSTCNQTISFISENEIPSNFNPENGIIVVCGFGNDTRAIIQNSLYKIMTRYSSFTGQKIFVSLGDDVLDMRPIGWMPIYTNHLFNYYL